MDFLHRHRNSLALLIGVFEKLFRSFPRLPIREELVLREGVPDLSFLCRSIRILLLGNYIEHLANTCIGTERVYSFLEQCQRTGLS